jgi:hypothetical protein
MASWLGDVDWDMALGSRHLGSKVVWPGQLKKAACDQARRICMQRLQIQGHILEGRYAVLGDRGCPLHCGVA